MSNHTVSFGPVCFFKEFHFIFIYFEVFAFDRLPPLLPRVVTGRKTLLRLPPRGGRHADRRRQPPGGYLDQALARSVCAKASPGDGRDYQPRSRRARRRKQCGEIKERDPQLHTREAPPRGPCQGWATGPFVVF